MNLKGLELFTVTKSETSAEDQPSIVNPRLYTTHATALANANDFADGMVQDMIDDPDCQWHAEYDDDGASVFVDGTVAYRFEVQLLTIVE